MHEQTFRVWYANEERMKSILKSASHDDVGTLEIATGCIKFSGTTHEISIRKINSVFETVARGWIAYCVLAGLFGGVLFFTLRPIDFKDTIYWMIFYFAIAYGGGYLSMPRWVGVDYFDHHQQVKTAYFASLGLSNTTWAALFRWMRGREKTLTEAIELSRAPESSRSVGCSAGGVPEPELKRRTHYVWYATEQRLNSFFNRSGLPYDDEGDLEISEWDITFIGKKQRVVVGRNYEISLVKPKYGWLYHFIMSGVALITVLLMYLGGGASPQSLIFTGAVLFVGLNALGYLFGPSTEWVRLDWREEDGSCRTAHFSSAAGEGTLLLGSTEKLFEVLSDHRVPESPIDREQ